MAELRDSGMNIDALHDWVEEHKLNMHHWFFSTDLTYYVRGGRISKSAGFIGSILHICPLLNCDDLGRLTPRAKIRTKKRAINDFNRNNHRKSYGARNRCAVFLGKEAR